MKFRAYVTQKQLGLAVTGSVGSKTGSGCVEVAESATGTSYVINVLIGAIYGSGCFTGNSRKVACVVSATSKAKIAVV